MELKPLDTDEFIVRRQEQFFGSKGASAQKITAEIAKGALILGANDVQILNKENWWIIHSNFDWLAVRSIQEFDEVSVFNNLWAFPEYGVNSNRSEVMARVFSNSCFTANKDKTYFIKGQIVNVDSMLKKQDGSYWKRTIGFKFAI